MSSSKDRRLNIWTPILFAGVLCFGMTLGFRLRDTLRNKRNIEAVIERNDRLEEIIDLITEQYVDTVNTNALYSDAVDGILSHLDPHTSYIPAGQLNEVNEDLEGSFFGIGVEFNIVSDTIRVTSVVEGGPAERAGVALGDQLIRVNDSVVAGRGITSERIIKMLRGKQFSRATVTLKDAISLKPKRVVIVRDAVPIYSVEANLMLDGETGYIKINRFAATTHEEFVKAMRGLQARGMKSLILDLRQNPGGFLDQAVAIADEFLDGDKTIVETRGRKEQQLDKAQYPGLFESGKLAVLIDESSASASEVLAGAIQDWDRGVILGRRSFGKGLVQAQYDLGDGSALRLTIAKYYTPSGRSVQRSFAKGKAAYQADFEHRFQNGELVGYDTVYHSDSSVYYTSSRRRVYGGGGIMPDIAVPYDSALLNGTFLNLVYGDALGIAVWEYYAAHIGSLKKYTSLGAFLRGIGSGDDVVAYCMERLPMQDRLVAERSMKQPVLRTYLETQILARLARILYRSNGYYAVAVRQDNSVNRAMKLLQSKEYSSFVIR
jgi:carboxyl-terminal processing protease